MNPNYQFAKSEEIFCGINIKLSDFNDIPSYSQMKKESLSLDENGENDYIPKSEQNIEEIIPKIFNQQLDVDETKDESNKGMNIYEQLNALKVKPKKFILDLNQKQIIQQKRRDEIISKKPFKEKKFRGRKNKLDASSGNHNKFSDDNLIRKIKNIILNYLLELINQKINSFYSKESKAVLKKKQLYKLSSQYREKSKVEYNKMFLNKTLEDIYSENISTKYSRHSLNHNKDLIKELTNDKDETKRIIFQKIFKLTFTECLEHFRGSCFKEELSGMKTFNEFISGKNFDNNDEDYKNILTIFIHNFETILNNKNSRKPKEEKVKQKKSKIIVANKY